MFFEIKLNKNIYLGIPAYDNYTTTNKSIENIKHSGGG